MHSKPHQLNEKQKKAFLLSQALVEEKTAFLFILLL